MNHRMLAIALSTTLIASTAATASTVTMDWVTIGNPGNAGTLAGSGAGGLGVDAIVGSVSYKYRMAAHEVTNAQYTEFLNAVAKSDPFELFQGNRFGAGIERTGDAGSYSYSTKPDYADKPVNWVTWYSAARFANWMTNGQGSGDTETGVYTLDGINSISSINRDLSDPNQVFLPNEDEWFKAAYHQPADQGGDVDDYWEYATQSNDLPTVANSSPNGVITNPGDEVVNYDFGSGWDGFNGNMTTVGSAENTSFYGLFDMNGNAAEWNETALFSGRVLQGGSWGSDERELSATSRLWATAWFPGRGVGFRLASPIPAPGAAGALALAGLAATRRRR